MFGKKKTEAPKEEKPKSVRAHVRAVSEEVDRRRKEAAEKLERLLAQAKAQGC